MVHPFECKYYFQSTGTQIIFILKPSVKGSRGSGDPHDLDNNEYRRRQKKTLLWLSLRSPIYLLRIVPRSLWTLDGHKVGQRLASALP
jgi:hypothetical protein